jgi:hypothetical protein
VGRREVQVTAQRTSLRQCLGVVTAAFLPLGSFAREGALRCYDGGGGAQAMRKPEGDRRPRRWRRIGLTIGVEAGGETVAQESVGLRTRRRGHRATQIEEAPKGGAARRVKRRRRPR